MNCFDSSQKKKNSEGQVRKLIDWHTGNTAVNASHIKVYNITFKDLVISTMIVYLYNQNIIYKYVDD